MSKELLPEISEKEIDLINYLQNDTPLSVLYKKYGNRAKYYYRKDKLFEKYDISTKLNIYYEKLGLTRFFVLSRHRFKSAYLVQCIPYYLAQTHFVSQFVIPEGRERNFIDIILKLDPEVSIYQAKELAPPFYNFKNFQFNMSHDKRLFRWMALIMEEKLPDLKISDYSPFEFNFHMLKMLHYLIKDLSREEIMEKMNMEKRGEYETPIKKMENNLYKKILSIKVVPKFLYLIERPSNKLGNLTLISSFIELFLFCHPFQIQRYYPERTNKYEYGVLCLLTPPTLQIPLFHHFIDDFLKVDSFLAQLGNPVENFDLHQVYEEKKENWIWGEDLFQLAT